MMEQAHIPLPEDIPFDDVLEALLDDEQILDPRYLYALSDIAGEDFRRLKEIWKEIDVVRRRGLIEDLEQLTESNTLLSFEKVFRHAIKDEDQQVRFYAVRAIEVFDTDDLVSTFLEILEGDASEDVRAVTASVLGKYIYRGELDKISKEKQQRIENALLEVINSDQPVRVRRRALEAMGYSPRAEAHREIKKAYHSGEEAWIASALFAMGRSYDHQYDEMVLNHLQHTAPEIRKEAVRACGELYLNEAVPIMLDLLDDIAEVRKAAIWSLSQIGGEEAGPAINRLLEENLTKEETELINQALERLSFFENGIDISLFDLPYDEVDVDDFDEDDLDLPDDAYWLE
jgi:HEAT repeat protein